MKLQPHIVDGFLGGKSPADLAVEYPHVEDWVQEFGPVQQLYERSAKIIARVIAGEKYEGIAADYGLDRSSIGRIMRDHGYGVPKGPRAKHQVYRTGEHPIADRNAAIVAAVLSGERQKDVAFRFGVRQSHVSYIAGRARPKSLCDVDKLQGRPEDRTSSTADTEGRNPDGGESRDQVPASETGQGR